MNPRVIIHPLHARRTLLAGAAGLALAIAQTQAQAAPAAPAKPATPAKPAAATAALIQPGSGVPVQIVLQNGVALPLSAVTLKGDKFEVKADIAGYFEAGATIAFDKVDHVFGDKPAAINQGIALILTGKPVEGRKLLIPVLEENKDSAKLPGNFWLEAARASLVANGLEGAAPQCNSLGKEIADATPAAGPDPFLALSKALLLHATVKVADREAALRAQTTDAQPADVCAYASYFLGGLLRSDNRNEEALDAYLAVSCLFPSGGMVINGVAQMKAAEILTSLDSKRRPEAVALVQCAVRNTKDTPARELADKLLESIK